MPILFADDTNLFINCDNLLQMVQIFIAELDDISNWLKINKLSLNVKKKYYMILTSKRNPRLKVTNLMKRTTQNFYEFT